MLVTSSTWSPGTPRGCSSITPKRPDTCSRNGSQDIAVLADAIRRVHEGECVLKPAIVARLIKRPRHREPLDGFTGREREVLALAEGRSNQAIASLLVLSPKTVEAHVGRVSAKLRPG